MLWYKGWLETRFLFLGGLIVAAFTFIGVNPGPRPPLQIRAIVGFTAILAGWLSIMFAGAGISTTMIRTKGPHGSTIFTLSLPVSRLRLLAVRAGLGWLGMAAILAMQSCALWIVLPEVRAAAARTGDMALHALTVIACASVFYSIAVLLAAFLDDILRIWVTIAVLAALWVLPNAIPWPQFADLFRAMTWGSPLAAHATP